MLSYNFIHLIKLVPLDQSDYVVPLDQRPHRPTKSDNGVPLDKRPFRPTGAKLLNFEQC